MGRRMAGRTIQCQKVILSQHLKFPPTIAQFLHILDKNTAMQLFKLLNKYHPETKQEKMARLEDIVKATADKREVQAKVCNFCNTFCAIAQPLQYRTPKNPTVKYGLNHCVAFIKAMKASLVIIAHDIDPI